MNTIINDNTIKKALSEYAINHKNDILEAVGYCRFSSSHQKELSIEAQQREILSYCAKNNLEIKEWYVDRAYSGKTDNRPEFQRLMKDIDDKSKNIGIVIVHKLDRFSRNVADTFSYKDYFDDNGIKLISVSEDFGENELMFGISSVLNQYYVQNLSKEVMKGLKERAYKTMFNGGVPPLGYRIVNGKYVIDESEATIVREIFNLAAEGYGYKSIIRILNEKGYTTRKGNTFGKNSIYDLLKNERYKGVYTFNKTEKRTKSKNSRNTHKHKDEKDIIRIEGGCPAIVSADLWERANASRAITAKTSTNAKNVYLLSGLMYCGECGCKMHGNPRKHGNVSYNTYKCNKQGNKLTCNCKEVHSAELESFVIDKLIEHFSQAEIVELITKQVNSIIKERVKSDSYDAENAKKALNGLKCARGNLIDAITQAGMNQAIQERLQAIEKQIAENEAIIKADENKKSEIRVTAEQVKEKIANLKVYFKNPEYVDITKRVIRNYVDKIVVSNNSIKVTIKVAFSFCYAEDDMEITYNDTIIFDRKDLKIIRSNVGMLPKNIGS